MGFSFDEISAQAALAVTELLDCAGMGKGDILVVGCSSSEVMGDSIGKSSSMDAARAVFDGILPVLRERGVWLAAQCCEHLNRAIILEQDCARQYGCEPVSVIPQPKAGGSFATVCWQCFHTPVAVEYIRAHGGLDIGGTFIGMHLKEVAVPVRLSLDHIGFARLLAARTRPKFIGGSRAVYE